MTGGTFRDVMRRVRVSQPLNRVATSTTRAVLAALGVDAPFVVRHLHRAGTVACVLPNGRRMKLWSRGDDWVSNELYWRGLDGYEPETVSIFLRYATRARVVVDVGAYVGFYTVLAACVNPDSRVFAFEPHPDAYRRLRRNVDLNRLANVECHDLALGEAADIADLHGVPGHLPTSSSLSLEFMTPHGVLRRIPVRVTTLDAFLAERSVTGVDLVKIDTETTEPDVLRGMARTLERDRPAIVCEVLAGRAAERDLEALLAPWGYRYYLLTGAGPERRTRIAGDASWLNYLFVCGDPA